MNKEEQTQKRFIMAAIVFTVYSAVIVMSILFFKVLEINEIERDTQTIRDRYQLP